MDDAEYKPQSLKAAGSEYNLYMLIKPSSLYVIDRFGQEELNEILKNASIPQDLLTRPNSWGSLAQLESYLVELRKLTVSEEEFKTACRYKLKQAYGPIKYLLGILAGTDIMDFKKMGGQQISSLSSWEVLETGSNFSRMKYTSKKFESRLLCLARQAMVAALPTLRNAHNAHVEEEACIGRGDDACIYTFRWFELNSWHFSALGLGVGLVAAAILYFSGYGSPISWPLIALTFTALGYAHSAHRTIKNNRQWLEETAYSLKEISAEAEEARAEALAIADRQHRWVGQMSTQTLKHRAERDLLLTDLKQIRGIMHNSLRSVSHDMGTPLTSLKLGASVLKEHRDRLTTEDLEAIIDEQTKAIEQLSVLLEELMVMTDAEQSAKDSHATVMPISQLSENLSRRASSLVHGKHIQTSVHIAKTAPTEIQTDQMLFDRIVDNLLINAAKYTNEGSIEVTLSGESNYFVMTITDTGRGIDPAKIKKSFSPTDSDPESRAPGSHGLGLSVVARLLYQLGGLLQVSSKEGAGSRFQVRLPLSCPTIPASPPVESSPNMAAILDNVVEISK